MRNMAAINSEVNSSLEQAQESAQRRAASERANIETAKTVAEISDKVQAIEGGLSGEREERKAADEENLQYTKKMDSRNFKIAVAGLIVGFIGVAIAVLSWIFPL